MLKTRAHRMEEIEYHPRQLYVHLSLSLVDFWIHRIQDQFSIWSYINRRASPLTQLFLLHSLFSLNFIHSCPKSQSHSLLCSSPLILDFLDTVFAILSFITNFKVIARPASQRRRTTSAYHYYLFIMKSTCAYLLFALGLATQQVTATVSI